MKIIKVCVICGKEFIAQRRSTKCCSDSCGMKSWRRKNSVHVHEYQHNWYHSDIEKSRKYHRDYDDAHPLQTHKKQIKWVTDHPKRVIECRQKNYKKNKVKILERNNIRFRNDRKYLRDPYIRANIVATTFLGVEIIPEMIDAKRSIMQLKRQRKN